MSKYIWIDPEIFNEENMGYVKEIEEEYKIKLLLFKKLDEAIDFIKSIDFEETKIIISGKLYIEFVMAFKVNITAMCVVPKIIIFTGNQQRFLNYNKDYEKMDNKFYNIGGIATLVDEIKYFLNNNNTLNKKSDSFFIFKSLGYSQSNISSTPSTYSSTEKTVIKKSDEAELIFEYIDKKKN